ncbi:hypothetical protein [Neptunomonas antarctica]|uniref:Uncharacterized protein n=1 Tax=Neptunomonas antarctica TaxID=619304 RepID=A0A1N7L4Y8_9GAMM|nr:hypothetical protein [Neptunomonas antarctica]SIS68887.1 hypothetical protein SAMN05421760_103237 [Neptunomonas antarctica]
MASAEVGEEGLATIDELHIDLSCINTHIFYLNITTEDHPALRMFLEDNRVVLANQPGDAPQNF